MSKQKAEVDQDSNIYERIGEFVVSDELYRTPAAAKVFEFMGFVPMRVEHLAYALCYKLIGYSHLFDISERGTLVAKYNIALSGSLEDDSFSVLAERLD